MTDPGESSAADGSPRTVLIAGVGPVIGTATAREFAAAGWQVALLARSASLIEDLASSLPTEAHAVQADVTDPDAVADAVASVEAAVGAPDCLVHNASAPGTPGLADCSPEQFRTTWAVRAFGAFLLARTVADRLRRGETTFIVSGTTYATEPTGDQIGWDSGAAAARGLVHSIAADGGDAVYVAIGARIAEGDTAGPAAIPARAVARTYRSLAVADDTVARGVDVTLTPR
ncbi:MAG: SDR family oxidoreductase [Halobacteriaceae archaeon]